ncbi:MAG: 5-formyltetrahydrofolate cyclo-ligase [Geminicoccaceae bacterium]
MTQDVGEFELRAQKSALRKEMIARRAALPEGDLRERSRLLAEAALREIPWRSLRRISLFWSLAGELDTQPLLQALHRGGATPLLPRMHGRGRPLTFHAWTPGATLVPGPMQVMEPPPDSPVVVPDIVLAPLLAFDRRGGRLGYGAGFYDRTLAELAGQGHDVIVIGYALAMQEVPAVPTGSNDVALRSVLTENGLIRCVA